MDAQRTSAWFEARKGKITGSIAGSILELNCYESPSDAMRRMVRDYHGAKKEFEGNIATAWGAMKEETAIAAFELETGLFVEETGFHVSSFRNWLGASPDGLIGDNAILEVKCPFSKRDSEEFDSIVNFPHYFAQMQIELYCTNREIAYFYQWSKKATKLEIVHRDDKWLSDAIVKLGAFHKEFLKQIHNPEHLEPKIPQIDDEELENEYEEALEELKKAQERMDAIKSRYIERANGRKMKIGNRLISYSTKKGSINYKRIIADHCPTVDVDDYRGIPTEYVTIKCCNLK